MSLKKSLIRAPYRNRQMLLTSHMGSMSEDCRTRMEIEATEETVRYLSG